MSNEIPGRVRPIELDVSSSRVSHDTAMEFVQEVKHCLKNAPDDNCRRFFECLRDYHEGHISRLQVLNRGSEILRNYPSLLKQFKTFIVLE